MQYTELRKAQEEKWSVIYKELGVFFAFNKKQFEEGAKGEKKIDSLGAGGLIPSKNINKYIEANKQMEIWFMIELSKINPDDVIHYELGNHEAYYTCDISSAFDVLRGYGYTLDQVKEVYKKNINK